MATSTSSPLPYTATINREEIMNPATNEDRELAATCRRQYQDVKNTLAAIIGSNSGCEFHPDHVADLQREMSILDHKMDIFLSTYGVTKTIRTTTTERKQVVRQPVLRPHESPEYGAAPPPPVLTAISTAGIPPYMIRPCSSSSESTPSTPATELSGDLAELSIS